MINIKKNDFIELIPETLCGNGNAIARDDNGFVYFVKGGVPGDRVRAKIIKVTKSYAVAIIDKLLESSELRVDSGCSYYGKCGGCAFQNISYEAECEFKRKSINDNFRRIGGLDLQLSDFIPANNTINYRNKATYPVGAGIDGKMIAGYYAGNSHRLCAHDKCSIGNPIFTLIRDFVVDFCNKHGIKAYDEQSGSGVLRHIFIRSAVDDSFVLTLVVNSDSFVDNETELSFVSQLLVLFPGCVSVLINVNKANTNAILGKKWRKLYGDGYLYDVLLGKSFRIASASFYQVNHKQAEILYSLAARFADIKSGDRILDLYCGTGTIGICLAKDGCELFGAEIIPEAVVDAKYNATQNGVNAEFICLDAGEALNSQRVKELKPDVIILDPPRKGCGDDAVEKIASIDAKKIVYISCDPATLSRDLKKFADLGYSAVKAVGVDLFPRTGHVECCVLLCKKA